MITIINYGVGNLKNVQNAFNFLGYSAMISNQISDIQKASVIVFPGVGAFEQGMSQLHTLNLIPTIKDHIAGNKPFLGICLGFQLLFEKSYENGEHKGLGILKGEVRPFSGKIDPALKIPQIGWNKINPQIPSNPIFNEMSPNPYVYFVHSYYVDTDENILTTTDYGIQYTSAIQKENLLATQFHPEKSGQQGLTLIKNFLEVNQIQKNEK